MRKNLLHLLVGIAAFLTGISAVYFFLGNTSGVERKEIIQDIRVENETLSTIDSASGKCGEFSDEIDLTPFLNRWISGEKFRDVPYCKDSLSEAVQFHERNVHPTYIDLNSDGTDELVLQSGCSPTGNCNMWIFERTGKAYRNIFASVHGVQTFKKLEAKNKGYFDLETRMTGGAIEGDMIVYRFNGNLYKPEACFTYDYLDKETRLILDQPRLDPRKCAQFLEK